MASKDEFLRGIRAALKRGEITDEPSALRGYLPENPALRELPAPLLSVSPADASELVELVKLANQTGMSLVPVSSGPPHYHGAGACHGDYAAVDLSGWKKILRVDRRNRVCMVEPGVTYGELLPVLAEAGLTLPMPLSPRKQKSVLAAVMDRVPSTWPKTQWDAIDPLCSAEIVFGTGDVFRAGAAGGPGSLEDQRRAGGAQKSPMGPGQSEFHRLVQGSQGAFGIVTWVTLRCELKPSVEEPRVLSSPRLEPLVSYVSGTLRSRLGEECFIMDREALSMLMHGRGGKVEEIRELPEFICFQNIAGFERLPRERVKYQLADLAELARAEGLFLARATGRITARNILSAIRNTEREQDWRASLSGSRISVFYLSTLDRAESQRERMKELARKHGLGDRPLGTYLQPVVQGHACHVEFILPCSPGEDRETLARFFETAVGELAREGAFFSRPYSPAEVELEFSRNPGAAALLKKMKEIFDPHKTLARGRFGL